MNRSRSSWKGTCRARYIEGRLRRIPLVVILPEGIAKGLALKGMLTVFDVVYQAAEKEEIGSTPITNLGLSSYVVNRLWSRSVRNLAATDQLSEREVKTFIPGLGAGAVREINEARARFGWPPIRKLP